MSFVFQLDSLVDKFPCYHCGMDPPAPPPPSPKDNPACLPDFEGRFNSRWSVEGVHRISMTAPPPLANSNIPHSPGVDDRGAKRSQRST